MLGISKKKKKEEGRCHN